MQHNDKKINVLNETDKLVADFHSTFRQAPLNIEECKKILLQLLSKGETISSFIEKCISPLLSNVDTKKHNTICALIEALDIDNAELKFTIIKKVACYYKDQLDNHPSYSKYMDEICSKKYNFSNEIILYLTSFRYIALTKLYRESKEVGKATFYFDQLYKVIKERAELHVANNDPFQFLDELIELLKIVRMTKINDHEKRVQEKIDHCYQVLLKQKEKHYPSAEKIFKICDLFLKVGESSKVLTISKKFIKIPEKCHPMLYYFKMVMEFVDQSKESKNDRTKPQYKAALNTALKDFEICIEKEIDPEKLFIFACDYFIKPHLNDKDIPFENIHTLVKKIIPKLLLQIEEEKELFVQLKKLSRFYSYLPSLMYDEYKIFLAEIKSKKSLLTHKLIVQLKEEKDQEKIIASTTDILTTFQAEDDAEEIAMVHELRGKAHFFLGHFKKALTDWSQVSKKTKELRLLQVSAKYKMNPYDDSIEKEALSLLEESDLSSQDSFQLYEYLIQLYLNKKEYIKVLEYTEKAFFLSKNIKITKEEEGILYENHIKAHFELGNFDKVIQAVEQLEDKRDISGFCDFKVESFLKKHEYKKAESYVASWPESNPKKLKYKESVELKLKLQRKLNRLLASGKEKDEYGNTRLIYAVYLENFDLIRTYLNAGANPFEENNQKKSAFTYYPDMEDKTKKNQMLTLLLREGNTPILANSSENKDFMNVVATFVAPYFKDILDKKDSAIILSFLEDILNNKSLDLNTIRTLFDGKLGGVWLYQLFISKPSFYFHPAHEKLIYKNEDEARQIVEKQIVLSKNPFNELLEKLQSFKVHKDFHVKVKLALYNVIFMEIAKLKKNILEKECYQTEMQKIKKEYADKKISLPEMKPLERNIEYTLDKALITSIKELIAMSIQSLIDDVCDRRNPQDAIKDLSMLLTTKDSLSDDDLRARLGGKFSLVQLNYLLNGYDRTYWYLPHDKPLMIRFCEQINSEELKAVRQQLKKSQDLSTLLLKEIDRFFNPSKKLEKSQSLQLLKTLVREIIEDELHQLCYQQKELQTLKEGLKKSDTPSVVPFSIHSKSKKRKNENKEEEKSKLKSSSPIIR